MRFINLVTVRSKAGDLVAMNRTGSIAIVDEQGPREGALRRSSTAPSSRSKTARRSRSASRSASGIRTPSRILTEIAGTVQFKDLQEGITLNEEVDEVTGLSRLVVADSLR